MSEISKFLGNDTYSKYKKIIYFETKVILENKKDFIQFDLVSNTEKERRVREICDFLYLEKDMENFKIMNRILKILQVKEKINSN